MSRWRLLTGRSTGSQIVPPHLIDAFHARGVPVWMGGMMETAQAAADYMREELDLKVGVVHVTCFAPFPATQLVDALKNVRAVTVLEGIQRSAEFLSKKGVDSPRLQAELLLAHVLKLRRMRLPSCRLSRPNRPSKA